MIQSAIITQVVSDTGRPDKTAMITQVVKAMIAKAHSIDYFPRDLVQVPVFAATTAGYDTTQALPTRWRKFGYIFQTVSDGTPITGTMGMEEIEPSDIFLYNSSLRSEIYFVTGDNIRLINQKTQIQYLRWGYYAYPDTSNASLETWLMKLDMAAQAIIDVSTMYVNKKLGNDTSAKVEQMNWLEWKSTLLAECLLASV